MTNKAEKMMKQKFEDMFVIEKKIAAKKYAKQLKDYGYKVFSSGWGAIVVLIEGRSVLVNGVEEDVQKFMRDFPLK